MLGTGIASAEEDVNPDKPASPLDGSVTVPVKIDNNALGSPLGQQDLPEFNKEVGVTPGDLTNGTPASGRSVPEAPALPQIEDATALTEGAAPLTEAVAPLGATHTDCLPCDGDGGDGRGLLGGDLLLGNRINGDVVAPVDLSGNAIAVLGAAAVENDSSQSAGWDNAVTTNGSDMVLAGNVIDLDWALPVQIANNAVAALGTAEASGTATQDATATGDIETDGSGGVLAGNVLAGQGATPAQVTGNALAGGGDATAESEAETSATSGGTILTDGSNGVLDGNAGAVPIALPAEINGNSGGVLAATDATSDSTAEATAGAEQPGMFGLPTYVETSGENSLGGGNVAQTPLAAEALLCGNAAVLGGVADAEALCGTETTAGGLNRTTGAGSVLGGTIADTPVALPVEGFGNAVAGVGTADALTDKDVVADAGGDSYTRGHESVLGGTDASTPVATPVDVFANPIAAIGEATTDVGQDNETEAGGDTGTTGDDSLGGGNMGTVPVAIPTEGFGNSVAGVGGAETTTVEETKVVSAGGGSNTNDDNGVGASNLLTAPVAGAAQLFGNSAGAVAFHHATATNDNEITAGGPANATGTAGLLSGNIAESPVSLPLQWFGTGASGLANGTQTAVNHMDMSAGGDATTDGTAGAGSGNVAAVPVGGAGQLYGDSIAALGLDDAVAGSETDSVAGGDVDTSGEAGFISGNVADGQALALVQGFGDAISGVGGVATALATNKTDASSGGDINTNGDAGFLSGNLADVPAGAILQPFGDAVAIIGSESDGSGLSQTDGTAGGTSTTSGDFLGSLSGLDATVPVGANAPIYDVPLEVLATAITNSANDSDITVGEADPVVNMPLEGGMAPTDLPTIMPQARSMPADAGAFTGVLDAFIAGMEGLPGQSGTSMLTDAVSSATQVEMPGEYHILPYPLPQDGRADTPGLPELPGMPGMPKLPGTPNLPAGGDMLKLNTPLTGDLFDGFGRDVSAKPGLPGLPNAPVVSDLDDLTDVTTVIPAVPAAADLLKVPGVPAVPGVTEVPGLSQVPGVSQVPGLPELPALPGLDTPGLNRAEPESLNATRVLLANLFTQHPIG